MKAFAKQSSELTPLVEHAEQNRILIGGSSNLKDLSREELQRRKIFAVDLLQIEQVDTAGWDRKSVRCHHELAHGGGTGTEFAYQLLTTSTSSGAKWFTNVRYGSGSDPVAWMYIEFPKPYILGAFGIKSANDCPTRDPKDFRFFAKKLGRNAEENKKAGEERKEE